jgi:threonine/homoserine/homoserine lactone efflux protein
MYFSCFSSGLIVIYFLFFADLKDSFMPESTLIWNYLVPGITFGFASAAQPGPLSVYLISRTLQGGWRRTFPAIFAPLISDGPIALACLLLLGSFPPLFLQFIRIPGGLFILYLAFRAAKTWKTGRHGTISAEGSSRKTLADAVTVNFLNPGPYLGWSLVIGPLFLEGWKEHPLNGISLLAGFYLTMFAFTALVIILFDRAREKGPGLQRILLGLSAVCLALFGSWQLVTGVVAITGLPWSG